MLTKLLSFGLQVLILTEIFKIMQFDHFINTIIMDFVLYFWMTSHMPRNNLHHEKDDYTKEKAAVHFPFIVANEQP